MRPRSKKTQGAEASAMARSASDTSIARRAKATASIQGNALPLRLSSSATIRRPGSSIVAKPRRRSSANNVDLPPEIYTLDQERRHDFAEAVAEYDRLIAVYPALG